MHFQTFKTDDNLNTCIWPLTSRILQILVIHSNGIYSESETREGCKTRYRNLEKILPDKVKVEIYCTWSTWHALSYIWQNSLGSKVKKPNQFSPVSHPPNFWAVKVWEWACCGMARRTYISPQFVLGTLWVPEAAPNQWLMAILNPI